MNDKIETEPADQHLIHLNKVWKARLIVCGIMLILALVGLGVMDLHPKAYWLYSRIMVISYAILSIWLHWYDTRGKQEKDGSSIWHQLLHWFGLLVAVYIISLFVNSGLIASMQAGLVTLVLLALTIFLAGIYTNPSFMLISLVLAIFAVVAALITTYLSVLMIPIIIIVAILIYGLHLFTKKKARKSAE